MRAVPPGLEEAATCLGSSPAQVLANVIVPVMTPTLIPVFFFLFMRSMVTLSAVIFLVTPSVSMAAVPVMRLDEAGFVSQAAAFSTCIMAVVHCGPRHAPAAGAAVSTRPLMRRAGRPRRICVLPEANEGLFAEARRARAEHVAPKYRKQPHAKERDDLDRSILLTHYDGVGQGRAGISFRL
jgi:hypothetical protein